MTPPTTPVLRSGRWSRTAMGLWVISMHKESAWEKLAAAAASAPADDAANDAAVHRSGRWTLER
jgi:hypothetical protein